MVLENINTSVMGIDDNKINMIATTTLLLLINSCRSPKTPLKSDVYLTKLAETRCKQMKDFSHTDYYNIFSKEIEKKYKFSGENLAVGFADATSTVQGWLKSPTHKEVLTAKRYQKIGVAVCEKAPKVYLTVTLYGGKN